MVLVIKGRYASWTYSMISEIIKLLHHNLFDNVQVCDHNVGLLTDIKSALHTQINNYVASMSLINIHTLRLVHTSHTGTDHVPGHSAVTKNLINS